MLDKKTTNVLKVLNKLAGDNAYKVITIDEILNNISQKNQYDIDSLRQIIDFLEKQEYINVKFSEENTYCYSLLPKARICIEQSVVKSKDDKQKIGLLGCVYVMISAFVGTMLALLIFFYLSF